MAHCLHCVAIPSSTFRKLGISDIPTKKIPLGRWSKNTARCTLQTEKQGSTPSTGKGAVPGVRDTVWDQKQLAVPSNPKLQQNTHADVIVVGGGIAGISVAYNLAKAGKQVVVLEARAIGSGQTGKTTAHLMPWFDDYYFEAESTLGSDKLNLIADAQYGAIDWIENVVKEEGIECNFRRLPGYLVPVEDDQQNAEKIRKEYEACKRAGLNDVRLEDLKHDPKNGNFGMALVFPNAGEFQPILYVKGLAEAAKKHGAQIFEQTSVVQHEGTKVVTDAGHTVTAKALVLATNSPINKNLAIHARQYARRSYVVGLKVPKGAIDRASWWDTASPYHYVRLEDKDDYEVLVVGGEDHKVGIEPNQYLDRHGSLEAWARSHWPAAQELLYKWSGQVYMPSDFLHLHGHDPLNTENVYVATGDSGQGMTGGTIAGVVISNSILGHKHRWGDLFDPSRFPPASLTSAQMLAQEVGENIEGFKNVLPGQGLTKLTVDSILLDEGAIIQEGLNKEAVYRDSSGNVQRYSAICPHLGCAVKWNPSDKTFDCPCHGSQFDVQGVVVNGPSPTNLTPMSYN
ncbi:hypothetical protein SELMODRAFT_424962 [Selaginella moellendorffii]|uniref:Rieske domain-containing protein n=1 Tax=Selaginella moellendorffii TaxID=88036 RepID=D8SRJ9_SELML|nr:uncharacterized protein LOC9640786 [Selaginella moellendorffii]EFJ13061.1 hypothetical protein SELMODRAFT_424962 [Selaginella moellendorffii]|eukprot:XP_002985884.1 uncharacterized protein LOC9640786 [Selaginella moellendorffii]